jgi:hypothetical protein
LSTDEYIFPQDLYDEIVKPSTDPNTFFWKNLHNHGTDRLLREFSKITKVLTTPPVMCTLGMHERKYMAVYGTIVGTIDEALRKVKRVERGMKNPMRNLVMKRRIKERLAAKRARSQSRAKAKAKVSFSESTKNSAVSSRLKLIFRYTPVALRVSNPVIVITGIYCNFP